MSLRISYVGFDADDPALVARFWAEVLSWRLSYESDDEWAVEPPEGSREESVATGLVFLKVPEEKTVKNRLHLDLRPDDQQAEVERVLSLGAARADVGQTGEETWVVLADPEGNEFCILRAPEPGEA